MSQLLAVLVVVDAVVVIDAGCGGGGGGGGGDVVVASAVSVCDDVADVGGVISALDGKCFLRNTVISLSTSLFEYPLFINICLDLLISIIISDFSEHRSFALYVYMF